MLAAEIAGADGVLDKARPSASCCARCAASRVLPPVTLQVQARAAARLDPRDRPIFAMRLAGTSLRDIAGVVGMTVAALNARMQAIVAQLSAPSRVAVA